MTEELNYEVFVTSFPNQIPSNLAIAEPLEGQTIDLEGYELVAIDLGHTDTDRTTCLQVPSIGLIVAGDATYNDVHLYMAESDKTKRQAWIAALRAGDPKIIEETREYIRDFDRLVETTTTAQELYDEMLELYRTESIPAGRYGLRRTLCTRNGRERL